MKIYYSLEELAAAISLSEATIQDLQRRGQFPEPRQLSAKRVGYLVEDVQEWARARPKSSHAPPPNTGAKKPRRSLPALQTEHQDG